MTPRKLFVKVEKCEFHVSLVLSPPQVWFKDKGCAGLTGSVFLQAVTNLFLGFSIMQQVYQGLQQHSYELGLEEWRHWLEEAEQPFVMCTDHKNLNLVSLLPLSEFILCPLCPVYSSINIVLCSTV